MDLRKGFFVRPIYLLYWTLGCLLVGLLIAPAILPDTAEDHSTHHLHDHAMSHGSIEVDPANAPTVEMRVERDAMAGWNIFLTVENFRFTPENVNRANVPNEGHAHLYLDGEKLTRLYSTSHHLADLPMGTHVLSVRLSANDHADLLLDGAPIAAEVSFVQPAR